ncbi:MAG: lipid-A-disaccharide synthase [Bacteroidales bacterium]|jgi:lipid-A-disaccharide synthase|nr:lipid-A-disaccharide synthase [Bacteroidales bacterium]
MKYFIISGEASGDLHASNLVKQIKIIEPEAEFEGWGGDLCIAQGVKITKHIKDLAFMGFVEVVQNLNKILKNFKTCKRQILQYNPDKIIFVDYPGFNLKMLKWAKKHNFETIYFISPNVWAWKTSRVKIIRDFTDKMFVILPFEKDFYAKYEIEVKYYGNPLVDLINNYKPDTYEEFCKKYILSLDKKLIAILPGSRKQELKKILPIMIKVSEQFPEYQFIIAGAPSINKNLYYKIVPNLQIPILFDKTYEILSHSTSALVKSGTATLETALFKVPQVVCYKANKLSIIIAKKLAKVIYISLPNLILQKQAVVELIQEDFSIERTIFELKKVLPESENYQQIKDDYEKLYDLLNNSEVYGNIAREIVRREKD